MRALKLLPFAALLFFTLPAWGQYTPYPGYGDKHWKAPVADESSLPASGNLSGDTRIVLSPASVYQWNGSAWSAIVPANVVTSGGTSTDKALARWNGTNGSTLQDSSSTTLSDLGLLTTPNLELSGLTASTVPYLDASKQLQSSSVSPTTLGYLDATSSIQTQLNGKQTTALASGDILVGNVSNVAAAVAPGGDVSMTNAGAFTVNTVGTSSASNIHSAEVAANAATNLNTVSTIVKRDGSGNFSAGTITASLTGNASTASALAATPTGCSANQFADAIAANGNLTCSTIPNAATTATNLNTASAIVARDASGNFSAGTITASLTGHASADLQASNNLSDVANKTTALDNLMPSATKGDIVVHNGTHNVALPVGSDGQVPVADSTQTDGLKWATLPSGGINYITNGTFESSASGWTTYADGAATPVDGTGGSPTLTITRTTTSPLRGVASGLITSGGLGNGAAYAFTIDPADEGHQEQIQFDYVTASGTIADGDYTVWIYDVTNAVLIQPVPYKIMAAPSIPGHFAGTFQAASNSTSYRLLIHQAVSSTGNLKPDSVTVGPQIYTQGPPVTDMATWAYTLGGGHVKGTVATDAAFCGRVGDRIHCRLDYRQTASGSTGGSPATFSLPSGDSFDDTKSGASTSGAGTNIGHGWAQDSAGKQYPCTVFRASSTTVGLNCNDDGTTGSHDIDLGTSPLNFGGSSLSFSFQFDAAIQGWSSGLTMNSDAGVTNVLASYENPSGILSGTYSVVGYNTKKQDTAASYSTSTGLFTAPSSGTYDVDADLAIGGTFTANQTADIAIYLNGSVYEGQRFYAFGSQTAVQTSIHTQIAMNAGDTIGIYARSSGTSPVVSFASSNYNKLNIKKQQTPQQLAASDTVAAVYKTASSGAVTSSPQGMDFDTKEIDKTGAVTGTGTGLGGTWKFNCNPGGTYEVSAMGTLAAGAWTAGKSLQLDIYKNGSRVSDLATLWAQASFTQIMGVTGTRQVSCNNGEYLQVTIKQDTGTNINLVGDANYNWVSIKRVGN